jgi:hypothetical protein
LIHRERNIPEIEIMYEQSFPRLSDRYFKQAPWPVVQAVEDLVDQDHVFCLLYKVGLSLLWVHLWVHLRFLGFSWGCSWGGV